MQYERSCGAVVFTRESGTIQYLIVQSPDGYYGFPKGHMEGNETEEQTALREIYEETGVRPTFIGGFRELDEHPIPGKEDVIKKVTYFLAEYSCQEIRVSTDELKDASLMDYETAMERLQFERNRVLLRRANDFLLGDRTGYAL